MRLKFTTYLILFFIPIASLFSQDKEPNSDCQYSTVEDKKAVKLYEKSLDKKKYNKDERLNFLRQAMELEPDYVDAIFFYASEVLQRMRLDQLPFKPMEPYLLKVIELCPDFHSDPYYYLGFSYYEQQKWEECVKYCEKYIAFKSDDDKKFARNYDAMLEQAKQMVAYAKKYEKEDQQLADLKTKPVPFDPKAVRQICSEYDEYLSIISPDDELMFFTRVSPDKSLDRSYQSDKWGERFCLAKRVGEQFDKGTWMPPPFNRNNNEGGPSISIDNKHLYFTIGKNEGGLQPNFDIYHSDFINGEWTEIKRVEGVNDPGYWDSQPSISADGVTLYFASNRPGGHGGIDLYKAVKDEKTNKWSTPVNLGKTINTSGNEKSPFMHSDSETLYFSSDGHIGLGKLDIFMSKKDEKGEWGEPKNIGYPINTEGEDVGFFVSTDGHYGYFSSNDKNRMKAKAVGGWDIYSFELYKEAQPDKVAFIKGKVTTVDGEQAKNAVVEIKDAKTKEKVGVVMDTSNGQYMAVVNIKKIENIIITVRKDSFAFNSQMVSFKDSASISIKKPVQVKMEVKPVEVNQTYTINNIYFGSNSSSIKEESQTVLEEFAEYLKASPNLKIMLQGHTDNVGDDASNMKLSDERANAVRAFLEQRGVEKDRMQSKGYGETKPVATNENELGRAKNRRTEFVVLEM